MTVAALDDEESVEHPKPKKGGKSLYHGGIRKVTKPFKGEIGPPITKEH